MMTSPATSLLPERLAEGHRVFTHVIPQLLPESVAVTVSGLSQAIDQRGMAMTFVALGDALVKWQWAFLSFQEATTFDEAVTSALAAASGAIPFFPGHHIQHDRAVSECISQLKSMTDSLSVFLNEILILNSKGGDRDLKKSAFRKAVGEKDAALKGVMEKYGDWLTQLAAVRDALIHWTAFKSFLLVRDSDLGAYPIPKDLLSYLREPREYERSDFESTGEFLGKHMSSGVSVLAAIWDFALEGAGASKDPQPLISLMPVQVTEPTVVSRIDFRNPT